MSECEKWCEKCDPGVNYLCSTHARERELYRRNQMTTDQAKPTALLPCGCGITPDDPLKSSVFWNPYNKVVQCHQCGQVYDTRTPSPAQAEPHVCGSLTDAIEVVKRAVQICEEAQIGLGEWKAKQESWADMDKRQVWNEAVIYCADAIESLQGKAPVGEWQQGMESAIEIAQSFGDHYMARTIAIAIRNAIDAATTPSSGEVPPSGSENKC